MNSLKERVAALESILHHRRRNHSFASDASMCFEVAQLSSPDHLDARMSLPEELSRKCSQNPPKLCNSLCGSVKQTRAIEACQTSSDLSAFPPLSHEQRSEQDHGIESLLDHIESTALTINSSLVWHDFSKGEILEGLISKSTEEYLLGLFWSTRYGHVSLYIDRELFLSAKKPGDPTYYTRSLEVCLLMLGLRCADPSRPDIQRLYLQQGQESILYRAGKQLVEDNLDKSEGLPAIQSLLVLGEMEASFGRYNSGWMYIGKNINISGVYAS